MSLNLTLIVIVYLYVLVFVRATEDRIYNVHITVTDDTVGEDVPSAVNTRSEDDSGTGPSVLMWPRKMVENLLSYIAKHWFHEIIPGTKYCGKGNISSGFDDMGYFINTDKCCREHDMCSDLIEPGATAHGLVNNDQYTKLNCNCDDRFLECLKEDNSKRSSYFSKLTGFAYFNMLNNQCFQEDYPIVECVKYFPEWYGYGRLRVLPLAKKCEDYKLNTDTEKTYQYFDPPRF